MVTGVPRGSGTETVPGVTVVVPTHRRPTLLLVAVRSVLAQDYAGPLEVLVVFDACEVHVPEVEPPPGRSLRVLENIRTRGLAGARNTGILAASHGFVAFLDDDDTWASDKLTEQMPLFGRHPGSRVVGTASRFDDGRRCHERRVRSAVVTHDQLVVDRVAALHSSSLVLRRDALVGELGLLDETLPRGYGEDTDLLLRASALAPVPVVDRPLVTVRWRGESHFVGRWADYVTALERLAVKHPVLVQTPAGARRLRSQLAFGLAASGRRRAGLRLAARVLRSRPGDLRSWLTLAVALRLTTPGLVVALARRVGKGI